MQNFLKYIFIYENDSYGWPTYRTNQLNWKEIKYCCKIILIKLWKIIKSFIKILIPIIIGYFLSNS